MNKKKTISKTKSKPKTELKPKSKTSKNDGKIKAKLTTSFLKLLMVIKVYHWKTRIYSEHFATDKLYESLNEYIDKFVEVMLGKDDMRLNMKGHSIEFTDPTNQKELIKIIHNYRILLEKDMNKYISINNNSDLYNIRDEILGELNQFLYLLSLK